MWGFSFTAFLAIPLTLTFWQFDNDRTNMFFLIFFEIIGVVLYKVWIAPSLAANHMEQEIAIPVLLFFIYFVLFILTMCAKKKKAYDVFLFTLVIWVMFLFVIGFNTPCPVCSMDVFFRPAITGVM